MSFTRMVLWVMAVGAILGGQDKICGKRIGVETEFEKGYKTMGLLALGMVGIVC